MKRHNVILESSIEPKDKNVLWLQGNKLKKFGNTGWEDIIEGDVVTTDRIENGAVTTEKIATNAFDSTLSKSEKIAPANIVGNKITTLDEKVDALALGKFYGYFPDSTSFPADVSIPGYAYVRLDNSYKIWNFNGESWYDSGVSINENDVIITTDRIQDGAVTTEKISTSAFDSTLSVSGKIAPSDVVGIKFTELGDKIGILNEQVLSKSLLQNSSVEQELINTDGEIVSSTLKTYFYDVQEGQKYLVKLGNFSSAGFSVVSLWNNNTFISSIKNSPTTSTNLFVDIPENVNKLAVSYFANSTYEITPINSIIENWQPIIKDFGYKGSLTNANLDDISIEKGVYFIINNQYVPFLNEGLLFVYGTSTYIQQRSISLRFNKEYVRTYIKNGWSDWKNITDQNFYKGSLNVGSIDSIQTEGLFYIDSTSTEGTLPSELKGRYCLLQIMTVGGNYTQQKIIDLINNVEYTRTYYNAWTPWVNIKISEFIKGNEKVVITPNLLPISLTSQTKNDITFTVNNNKTITATGTASARVILLLGEVSLSKGQYWIGGTPTDSGNTRLTIRVIYGSGGYKDLYQGKTAKYQFEVQEESDIISVYALIYKGTTCPENCIYKPYIVRVGSLADGYIQQGSELSIGEIEKLTAFNTSWAGKKICGKGDSIMAGAAGNWLNVVAQRLGLSVVNNYGIGGSRMAYYGDGANVTAEQSVVATWNEMDADADIVIIHAGTNDWASQVPLGDENSVDKLEFNGALNIVMSGLRAKYPTALIIFNTILPRVDYDATIHRGLQMPILTSQYSEAIKKRCKAHHIVCYDIYESCGLDFDYDYKNKIYAITNDGLHPNEGGAKILGRKIAGFINIH